MLTICLQVSRGLFHCLAYGNSCMNPMIYSVMSTDFRRAFRSIVSQLRGESSRGGAATPPHRTFDKYKVATATYATETEKKAEECLLKSWSQSDYQHLYHLPGYITMYSLRRLIAPYHSPFTNDKKGAVEFWLSSMFVLL